jgi:predicted acetyltransferase
MNQKINFINVNDKNFGYFIFLLDKMAVYEKHQPLDVESKKRLKKDALTINPKYDAYLVKYNGDFIGYIMVYMTYSSYLASPVLHIEDLFLLNNFRRRGIGQKMFGFCIEKANEKDCGRIEWTVYDWNKQAIMFYKKFNATCLNKKYYRLDRKQIEQFLD